MRFSRRATSDDFSNEINSWRKRLPEKVIELADLDETNKAISELRQITGMGLLDCKNIISNYQSVRSAMFDFINGEDVFAEY